MVPRETHYDVIVVGSGNAGFSAAAAAARDHGARSVLLLEKAPEAWAGGNTTFTAGAFRTVFHGLPDLQVLLADALPPDVAARIDVDAYLEEDFEADLHRVTGGRTDPRLARVLVEESRAAVGWLRENGVRFRLAFERQAYRVGERWKFWGGMALAVVDGGKGLTRQHQQNASKRGVEVLYSSPVTRLLSDASTTAVTGVTFLAPDGTTRDVFARGGVILCAGGFEANPDMRAHHLGPSWERVHVRGTPHNTGDLLHLAMHALHAAPAGDWSGCHSVAWDADAPADRGDLTRTNRFTKSGYPLGLMLNVHGQRFVDEGLDLRNFTYAKFGREILAQPGAVAFQVWDGDGVSWLPAEEYGDDVVEKMVADSVPALARKLTSKGLMDAPAFAETIETYNAAVAAHRKEKPFLTFDPSRKDGLSTRSRDGGLPLDKTNWALPLRRPPFTACQVTAGITFTFGGLAIDPATSGVLSERTGAAIPGLYCAGEMVGGLFHGNYPGGSGLTAGTVFGRRAGRSAAVRALGRA